jgi:hypothetical protein
MSTREYLLEPTLMSPIRTFNRPLPAHLTDRELLEKAAELAETIQNYDAEEEQQAYLKKSMKARLDELAARRTQLSLVVSRREEIREVKILVVLSGDGLVQEVRDDTGEIIRTRPIEETERQGLLRIGMESAAEAKEAKA